MGKLKEFFRFNLDKLGISIFFILGFLGSFFLVKFGLNTLPLFWFIFAPVFSSYMFVNSTFINIIGFIYSIIILYLFVSIVDNISSNFKKKRLASLIFTIFLILILFIPIKIPRSEFIHQEPDPFPADINNPISLSRDNIILVGTNTAKLKISLYNPTNTPVTISPEIFCFKIPITSQVANSTIPPNTAIVFNSIIKTKVKTFDTDICQVKVNIDNQSYFKEFMLEIK
jgi:hypothetical protein